MNYDRIKTMPAQIGIGFGQNKNTAVAARSAAQEARIQLGQSDAEVVFLFTTPAYSPLEALHAVRQTLNTKNLIGCSTAGLILPDSVQTRGISVIAINSQEIDFNCGFFSDLSLHNPLSAGTMAAKSSVRNQKEKRRGGLILFTDGQFHNTSTLIRGAQEVLGRLFPIIGANASDDFNRKPTYQYCQDKAVKDSAVSLLLEGPCTFATASRHGWRPLGKPRIVTNSEQNIIHAVDGKTAAGVYQEYFNLSFEELQSPLLLKQFSLYPLGMYQKNTDEFILRNVVEVRPNGSLVCQGDIPLLSQIHLMIANKDSCKQAACEAALEVKEMLENKKPQFLFVSASLSRLKILSREAIEEIRLIKDIFGFTIPLFGMYSYGEIAPVAIDRERKESQWQSNSINILGVL